MTEAERAEWERMELDRSALTHGRMNGSSGDQMISGEIQFINLDR